MLKKLYAAVAVFCASASLALASNHPAPGSFGVTGEYLYLLPSVDDTYFVINAPQTDTNPNGQRLNNDFNYSSGYRVGAAYAFCDCGRELAVSYTHLNSSQKKTVNGSFLWATLGRADLAAFFENYAGTAVSDLDVHYQSVDPIYTQSFYKCCNVDFRFVVGLQYASFKLDEEYVYTVTADANIGTVDQESKTWGIGPKVGLELNYEVYEFCGGYLPGKVSVNVSSNAVLLSAHTKTSVSNVYTTGGVASTVLDVTDEKTWRVVPGMQARVGLNFSAELCRMLASIEVGYEYDSYFRGIAKASYPDDVADSLSITNYYNFDMQGLYVSASLGF